MNVGWLSQRVRDVVSWSRARPGVLATCAGAVLGLITVAISATNSISAQQAIAMALPAIAAITGGLIHTLVRDSWAAWRRGFEQGCQAALLYRVHSLNSDAAAASDRTGVADAGRLTERLVSISGPTDAAG